MAAAGVTIATTTEQFEANLIKERLEANGVEAWLADDAVVGANPLLSNAIGGVKVQVAEADVERAKEVLDAPQPDGDGCLSCGAPMAEDADRCAKCGWTFAE